MSGAGELPPEAWAAALAGLPAVGPARLRALLATWSPEEAWERVAAGAACSRPAVALACRPDPAGVAAVWQVAARRMSVADGWAALASAGVTVMLAGGFPPVLLDDPEPPAVLFSRGDWAALDGRRVAIVGTRRCTRYGRDVAYELGRDLAEAGVRVVSGLALGIDGAAHRGALAAGAGAGPPVGVVGSGLDVVYPPSHRALWEEVAGAGLLVSEAPLGGRPEPWRFPVRNRVIAALSEVVVVVESAEKGGSRHTVEAAMARDRLVMAVPGSVRSPVSAYCNALIADGCHPVRDALDVLVALGLSSAPADYADRREPPGAGEAPVLDALGWEPATFDDLCARTGQSPGQVSVALARLQAGGWVAERAGWWERVT